MYRNRTASRRNPRAEENDARITWDIPRTEHSPLGPSIGLAHGSGQANRAGATVRLPSIRFAGRVAVGVLDVVVRLRLLRLRPGECRGGGPSESAVAGYPRRRCPQVASIRAENVELTRGSQFGAKRTHVLALLRVLIATVSFEGYLAGYLARIDANMFYGDLLPTRRRPYSFDGAVFHHLKCGSSRFIPSRRSSSRMVTPRHDLCPRHA
jgi:hypothetical protein